MSIRHLINWAVLLPGCMAWGSVGSTDTDYLRWGSGMGIVVQEIPEAQWLRDVYCDPCMIRGLVGNAGADINYGPSCFGLAAILTMGHALEGAVLEKKSAQGWQWLDGQQSSLNSDDLIYNKLISDAGLQRCDNHGDFYNQLEGYEHLSPEDIVHLHTIEPPHQTRDTSIERVFAWIHNDTGTFRAAFVPESMVSHALSELNSYLHDSSNLHLDKRGSPPGSGTMWLTYTLYGVNLKRAKRNLWADHSMGLYLATSLGKKIAQGDEWGAQDLQSKFCLSWQEQGGVGDDSIIVGEVYANAWGGLDNECTTT